MVKKGIIFLFIICIGVGCVFLLSNNKKDELRLRIISNSNTEKDQLNKKIIKEALKEILKDEEMDIHLIEKRLTGLIDDEIFVSIEKSYYPAKTYDDKFVPSGLYDTLLITIGDGNGSNFWTLLYPEYFNISFEDDNEIEYRFYIIDILSKLFSLNFKSLDFLIFKIHYDR